MNTFLYFIIKFYPFWGPIVAISLFSVVLKFLKRKNYLFAFLVFLLICGLLFLTYLYFAKDGLNNAVPFFRQWLV